MAAFSHCCWRSALDTCPTVVHSTGCMRPAGAWQPRPSLCHSVQSISSHLTIRPWLQLTVGHEHCLWSAGGLPVRHDHQPVSELSITCERFLIIISGLQESCQSGCPSITPPHHPSTSPPQTRTSPGPAQSRTAFLPPASRTLRPRRATTPPQNLALQVSTLDTLCIELRWYMRC